MLSQAVDHLIRAGDAPQAVDAVEQAAPGLNEQSQMSVLIGLAANLPVQLVDTRPAAAGGPCLGKRRVAPPCGGPGRASVG